MLGQVDHNRSASMNQFTLSTLGVALLLSACGGGGADTPAAAQVAATAPPPAPAPAPLPLSAQPNPSGAALTFTASGTLEAANPFFKALGNGRSCASCHDQGEGWSITPQGLQARFAATEGTHPIFKLIDGANSPLAPVATLDQKRLAYSMLLTRGVIRIGLPIPAGAQFSLVRADDPYGFASAAELSLFRRPLPSANLKFASAVMWDGRESVAQALASTCIAGAVPAQCYAPLDENLARQANNAVRGHAQFAAGLSAAEQGQIVAFEKSLLHAQASDLGAGDLAQGGAAGGPARLAGEAFYFGINDVLAGDYLSGAPFDRAAMNLFGAWRNLGGPGASAQDTARAAIARGEALFNNRQVNIVNVAGFNGPQRGTCTSCHNAPNSGAHSVARTFNTGVAAAARRSPDMPLYTLRNDATGETLAVTDPGSALVTGRWSDVGSFKTPNLRGAAARAPFFHDGSAPDLEAVVRFYDRRFQMGLNPQEVADLAAFLKAL
jgi:cytochrome c peroxidase